MHTEYEYLTDNDVAALQAEAAYYDEVAQQPARPTLSSKPEPLDTHHLKLARRHMAEYEQRINDDRIRFSDIVDRQVYEDRAYKRAMLHAALAAAQAQTRQAEVAESFLEFVAELIDKTDLVNSLLQWGYKQERIG